MTLEEQKHRWQRLLIQTYEELYEVVEDWTPFEFVEVVDRGVFDSQDHVKALRHPCYVLAKTIVLWESEGKEAAMMYKLAN